jgi:hypothetical protein
MRLGPTISDGGLNLFGLNGVSGVAGAGAASLSSVTPTAEQAPSLQSLVEPGLSLRNGDGYISQLERVSIAGGGLARDYIDASDCGAVITDARGEDRPDELNLKCDVGAYEFTVLNCQDDAQRRYQQGETFIKSCESDFENFELSLGYFSYILSVLMGLVLVRRFAHSRII